MQMATSFSVAEAYTKESHMASANHTAGDSKDGNTNLSFMEASISDEPSAVVPHAGIGAGAVG